MSEEVCIRPAGPADEDRVVEIALCAWEPIYAARREIVGAEIFGAIHPDWRADKARDVRHGLSDERGAAFVAERGGQVAGFVTVFVQANEVGEIGNNAVHPDHQGRGIATRLYERALDWLRESGVQFARVRTGLDDAHAPARRAYDKVGFGRGVPMVTYHRKL